VQLRSQHDAQFPPTEFDERFDERPTVKGLIHTKQKLHQALGVPYIHIQAMIGSTVNSDEVETQI